MSAKDVQAAFPLRTSRSRQRINGRVRRELVLDDGVHRCVQPGVRQVDGARAVMLLRSRRAQRLVARALTAEGDPTTLTTVRRLINLELDRGDYGHVIELGKADVEATPAALDPSTRRSLKPSGPSAGPLRGRAIRRRRSLPRNARWRS